MVFLFNKLINAIMTYVISCYYPLEYGQTHRDAQKFTEEIIIDLIHVSQRDYLMVHDWETNEETPEDYMCYNAVRIDILIDTDCSCIQLYWSYAMLSDEEFKTEAGILSDRLHTRIPSVVIMWAQTINYMFTLKLLTHLENQGESIIKNLDYDYPLNLFKEDTTRSKFALLQAVHMILSSRVIVENGNMEVPDWSKWKLPRVYFISPKKF